ncbi:DUF4286 family protein [Hydrogenophaga sp. BPS33]|uniref:DUF4286 family protein n=1 Tax=Hydrogenophaga sp. BPS33 TaxID=2651974 RepID=UPI0013204F3F|nr:DUF4286 family protein [Hydrogenophaga sp. BPS33]QHE84009.1 hypothetical protein F9K07_03460 [Hydrogenophaga sp. BPS33]
MQGPAILFSEMTPPALEEASFNHWYDEEHIPLRMAVPGFRSAQRYRSLQDASYLAVYEMDSLETLNTPAYQQVKGQPSALSRHMLGSVSGFTRYLCDTIWQATAPHANAQSLDAAVLYPVFFKVPEAHEDDFNAWYEQDHVPLLFENTDWLMCRRFRIRDGEPGAWTHLALHYLAHESALDSPERERARATPWRTRLSKEAWFKAHYLLFKRQGARQTATPCAATPV